MKTRKHSCTHWNADAHNFSMQLVPLKGAAVQVLHNCMPFAEMEAAVCGLLVSVAASFVVAAAAGEYRAQLDAERALRMGGSAAPATKIKSEQQQDHRQHVALQCMAVEVKQMHAVL
jgi:hypothetical protein